MNKLHIYFFSAVVLLFTDGASFAQSSPDTVPDRIVTFRFVPGDDMFYIPWEGNGEQLTRLYSLVDEYRAEIASGAVPVYVDGYCASLPTAKENLNTAYIRANRVKSELILHKGLTESNFTTKNYAKSYTAPDGTVYKDMVVVTLRIPTKGKPEPRPVKEEPRSVEDRASSPTEARSQPETGADKAEGGNIMEPEPQPVVAEPVAPSKPYCLAVRTNLLYDAFLLPTLGVEWRVNRDIGVKLDGSRSWWGDAGGKVQKIWLVSPEVRWYLLDAKRFYVGASGTFGQYNIYKYPVGGLFSSDTGYQGKLWNAGLTVGYQLYLSGSFSLDFNLGVGYTRSQYDNFTVTEGVRIYKEKDKTKNFFGPTQAGISLVWTIGGQR